MSLPPVSYLLLWHQRFNHDSGHRWLREYLHQQITHNLPAIIAPYRAQQQAQQQVELAGIDM